VIILVRFVVSREMNTASCPEGFFTDEILMLPEFTSSCQGRTAVWLGLAIPLLIIRWLLLLPQVVSAKNRRQRARQTSSGSAMQRRVCSIRVPFFLLSQVSSAFFSSLLVILASANVASTRDGGSLVLFGFFVISVAVGHMIMARTVIKLGKKIIPLSSKRLNIGDGERLKGLSTVDLPLRVFLLLGVCLSIVAGVLFIINMGFDATTRKYIFQASFYCIAAYQLFGGTAIVYQYQRCLWAVSKLTFGASGGSGEERAVAPGNSSGAEASSPAPSNKGVSSSNGGMAALKYAMLAMRVQQVITGITAVAMMVGSLVFATFVVPIQYWIYCLVFLLVDIFFQASLLFAPMLSKLKARKAKQADLKKAANLTTVPEDTKSATQFSSKPNPNTALGSYSAQ
jgi:hypothetical protein